MGSGRELYPIVVGRDRLRGEIVAKQENDVWTRLCSVRHVSQEDREIKEAKGRGDHNSNRGNVSGKSMTEFRLGTRTQ